MPGTLNLQQAAELGRLLADLARVYGYDFRDYAEASLRRRLLLWLAASGFGSFETARRALLRDPALFEGLLDGVTVNVSEMFRDPQVFKLLREQVVPHLATYPFVKIWHAGCASGEEAYSMAILLDEEGLKGRYRIYATDINQKVLKTAQDGIFPLSGMRLYTQNYQKGGGRGAFSDYYTAGYDHALLSAALKEGIVFAQHNLAVDGCFGEMQFVLCRNVLIYFKQSLRRRVLELFDSSLTPGGFLCLGTKETLAGSELAPRYQELAPRSRVYRKRYG
ncbi:chemotaxis protein R [Geomonas silvestris]|uniref:Chemotaxis protein R n=1 Tax=Geomonas silvestris TaxID=2740184 RepID=A0A6V8MKX7_9BACT|nr:protein-glutamate O-methyltransferase CheR [Geomonas silvestris]GFO60632.1 chemotaxis protein R [Geomonas silvestris]